MIQALFDLLVHLIAYAILSDRFYRV